MSITRKKTAPTGATFITEADLIARKKEMEGNG